MSSGRNSQRRLGAWVGAGVLLSATPAHAMHIADGVLPLSWAALWWLLALPFVALGLRELRTAHPTAARGRTLLGLTGAAVFVISCIPIPVPLAGTDSHLCGTGLAALFIGPGQTVVVASVVLVLQALFLAHGGLTTLGADIVSGKLLHNGDLVLTWMVGNVTARVDAKENVYPRKARPENKIDGAVALIGARGAYINLQPQYKSAYADAAEVVI